MRSQQQRIFVLRQVVDVGPDNAIAGCDANEDGNVVVVVTRDGSVAAVAFDHGDAASEASPASDAGITFDVPGGKRLDAAPLPLKSSSSSALSYRRLCWFRQHSTKCVCFSPDSQLVLVCSKEFDLAVVHAEVLLPRGERRAPDANGDNLLPSAYPWSSTPLTRVPKTSSDLNARFGSPSRLLWWATVQEDRNVAVVATDKGWAIAIDLVTGAEVASVSVTSNALLDAELITDASRDATHLLLTCSSQCQWRVLVERRSTGFVWGSGNASSGGGTDTGRQNSEQEAGTATATRSRLSGLKQLSVAGLANLRQRLNERKRQFERRLSSSSSSSLSEAALTVVADDPSPTSSSPPSPSVRPESLSTRVGSTVVSARAVAGDALLAGIFPDTAVMTLHSADLELLPHCAYKLPNGTDKMLLIGPLMVTSSCHPRREVHVVSSHHAELHLDAAGNGNGNGGGLGFSGDGDAVVQSFALPKDETVLTIVRQRTAAKRASQQSDSSDNSISRDFGSSARARADAAERAGRGLFHRCLVVTTRSIFELMLDEGPVNTFLEMAMNGEYWKAEQVALAFGMDAKELLELSGDLRLASRDLGGAAALFRQAGCRHLKIVLKLAVAGHMTEMLSYIVALFKAPAAVEVSPADRIHLSNLALMAYFQQVLTKSTPSACAEFRAQIRDFLDSNRWFDECLSVRMATETAEWDLLAHISRSRGLTHEVVEAVLAAIAPHSTGADGDRASLKGVASYLQSKPSAERNGLLSCLLSANNVEAVSATPTTASRLLAVMAAILPMLEEHGLQSVVDQTAPNNPGLARLYNLLANTREDTDEAKAKEIGDAKGDEDAAADVAKQVLELFVSASLLLIKKRPKNCNENNCDDYFVPVKVLRQVEQRQPSKPKGEHRHVNTARVVALGAGVGHVLHVRGRHVVLSWGASAAGVLGHGATGARYVTPRPVCFLPGVRVVAVACGKAHSLALTEYSEVYSWGSSRCGQLGLGPQRLAEQRPSLIKAFSGTPIVGVAAGHYHSAAVDTDGHVWTWGWGVHGQLGTEDIEDEPAPVCVVRNKGAVQVSAGYAHTVMLCSDGSVWAFGSGLFGQLGTGETRKSTGVVRVRQCPRVGLVASGLFHNVAVTCDGRHVYVWGCNPQVLRFEAQQKKRGRLLNMRRAEQQQQQQQQLLQQQQQQEQKVSNGVPKLILPSLEDLVNGKSNGSNINNNNNTSETAAKEEQAQSEADEKLHLLPQLWDSGELDETETIVEAACGNQHSMLLTSKGQVLSFGRNLDGQLGLGSRKESKAPSRVTALSDDVVCHVACGPDYSVAVSETGTVFAWGSNSSAQHGRAPIDEDPAGTGAAAAESKVLVVKSARRIIRLPNNANSLQNSSDVPRPVAGVTAGVYSDVSHSLNTNGVHSVKEEEDHHEEKDGMRLLPKCQSPGELLRLSLEVFHAHLDAKAVIKKCLVADNLAAAATLSMACDDALQAFEFTLQLNIRRHAQNPAPTSADVSALDEAIFAAFLFYVRESSVAATRCRLLQRLVSCWQDQRFSFVLLEKLFLAQAEDDVALLQTLVLTLFCPVGHAHAQDGPPTDVDDNNEDNSEQDVVPNGPKMSDLFTPEFCLRIGDSFVRAMREETRSLSSATSATSATSADLVTDGDDTSRLKGFIESVMARENLI